MPVLMFQERFAAKVADGTKRQTIRPRRKRPIKAGDVLSLRKWSGLSYASKQEVLRQSEVCNSAATINITCGGAYVDHRPLNVNLLDDFAELDGFDSFADMVAWFEETHGLPFEGDLIRW